MTGRQAAIAVGAGLVLALALAWLFLSSRGDESGPTVLTESGEEILAGEALTLRLYFPGDSGRLVAEERQIPSASGADLLRATTAEVLAGPSASNLFAPFPEGTEAGTVFVSEGGIAFVDLVSTRPNPPSSGSRDEMLSVYSIVNSLLANLPEIQAVVLLWNGQQRPSFAGHLDTGRPLTANESLLAAGG
jgi:spore germination protein GerM